MSQFLVVDRATRRVRHQTDSLPAARGYVEACKRPTCIAVIAETHGKSESMFRIEVVNDEGRVLARTCEIEFLDAVETFLDSRLVLVPAYLSSEVQL